MAINLTAPDVKELKPRITVFGVGGAGGNAVNNMISCGLEGVEFVVANTDAQALASSKASRVIQMGLDATQGLGAGSQPDVGASAAQEVIDEIKDQLDGSHMVFITCGMGGGTGTGAAPVIAQAAKEMGILTVGVVTKPFQFEGLRRMRLAEDGVEKLQAAVDTLIVIPNQNLFRIANEKTTFADAFALADQVLYSGVASITDLMVKEGLINLDFADVRAVMRGMGKAMMGTGESTGEKRALAAAEAAIANPLLDDVSMKGAKGLLISITGGRDLTLYEVDEAATRIREEVDQEANIILGATFDETLEGVIRVSVVATGIDDSLIDQQTSLSATERRIAEVAEKLKAEARARVSNPAESNTAPKHHNLSAGEAVQSFPHPVQHEAAQAPVLKPLIQQPQQHQGAAMAMSTAPQQRAIPPQMHPGQAPHPQQHVQGNLAVERAPSPPQSEQVFQSAAIHQPRQDNPGFAPQSPYPVQDMEAMRPVRMPRIDELPIPAQNEIHASRNEAEPKEEHKRVSLLQRLASVGFGVRREEDDEDEHLQVAPPAPSRRQEPVMHGEKPAAVHREYSRRPYPQHSPSMDDEQLEIPAFLRRQAN